MNIRFLASRAPIFSGLNSESCMAGLCSLKNIRSEMLLKGLGQGHAGRKDTFTRCRARGTLRGET